ncbi:MAG: hypothetical protein IID15_08660 [Candidatus Marinimicrobia bacterium]|nr:hypothetical protein [Candidatus Neomarinimicrobiota bacterium]
MQVKTYTGATEREAITMAKQDLGDDIMIVEMKRHGSNGNGRSAAQYLVTVALDTHRVDSTPMVDDIYTPANMRSVETARSVRRTVNGGSDQASIIRLNEQEVGELFMLRKQMRTLKAELRASEISHFDEPFANCYELLVEAGVPDHIAEQLVQRTVDRLDEVGVCTRVGALEELKRQISYHFVHHKPRKRTGKEVIVFMGPSGAGKTSIIAKLAAHKQAYRGRKLAIVSTDNYRAGANAGLKSIGSILDTPIIEVLQMEDIPRAMANLEDFDVILVDTPGRSPLVKNAMPELQTRLALLNPTDTIVVLSATMGMEELWLFTGLYKSLEPTGLAITKLDETSKPGKIIGAADDPALPLMYVSDGRAIPKSLILNPGAAILKRLPLTIG